jgi:2-polyprenyl-6-methoxyphenol hydroxylase-like FAD-dependent oxidoreductase
VAELGLHAVVLGAGIAGLMTAGVLSEFYTAVTMVERDALPDHPAQRKGVPQGRHLHNLYPRGAQILGELFPGLLDELVAAGAVLDTTRRRFAEKVMGELISREFPGNEEGTQCLT